MDIIIVQSIARCHLASRSLAEKKESALKIQQIARRWISSRLVLRLRSKREMIRNEKSAAVLLQSAYRGYVERQTIRKFHTNATILQSTFRSHYAKMYYEYYMMNIIIVQSIARRFLIHKSLKKHYQSAVDIQSAFRGHLERRAIRRMHKNATVLQSAYRSYVARIVYQMDIMDITIVQSFARRWLVGKSLMKQHLAAVVIQSTARRTIASKTASYQRSRKLEQDLQTRSGVTIQRLWRGYKGRVCSSEHAAARRIQKTWRCFITHIDYLIQVVSVMKIQATTRRFLSHNSFCTMRHGFIKLQAVARGNFERHMQLKASVAAVIVQSAFRAYSERLNFSIYKYATTLIQRHTRGYLCRVDQEIASFAACEIQRVWRGYNQFVDFVFSVLSAIKIQSVFRMRISMNAYREMELIFLAEKLYVNKKALVIQDAFQRYTHKKRLFKAAITIQVAACAFLHRQRSRIFKKGIVRLQAAFRAKTARHKRPKKISLVARRVIRANKRAREDPKLRLGYRTHHALDILQNSASLSAIMEAVKTLEASTRLSIVCCAVFTKANAAKILLEVVVKCNRSVPHVELVNCILLTLDNVARHRPFVSSFADYSAAEVFLDKMQAFRDKDSIFCLCVDLLKRIADCNPSVQEYCASHEHLKRLKGLYQLSTRGSQPLHKKNSKTKENRMKRREFFDRHQSVKLLGGLIRTIESLEPVEINHQKHFTF